MMLLKQQNWEQWQGAGISSGNWGVCQEAFSPAGSLSAPTPHLSYKHTQKAPPLRQYSLWPDLVEYLAISGLPKPSCSPHQCTPESHSRVSRPSSACRSTEAGEGWAAVCDGQASRSPSSQGPCPKGNLASAHCLLPSLHTIEGLAGLWSELEQ